MDFFCLIALRDWFVNLNDRILREAAGEQAIDHYWPCNTRVSPATRRFVTSLGKCLQGGCGTYNEPRPLASLVFFSPSRPHTYFVVSEETPVQKRWYWRHFRKCCQSINQSKELRTKLKMRLDHSCFQVVMFTPYNVDFVPFGELL